jgi:hypothetical protein
MFDYLKDRNDKLDALLQKMEKVVQDNMLVVSQITESVKEAKEYSSALERS